MSYFKVPGKLIYMYFSDTGHKLITNDITVGSYLASDFPLPPEPAIYNTSSRRLFQPVFSLLNAE